MRGAIRGGNHVVVALLRLTRLGGNGGAGNSMGLTMTTREIDREAIRQATRGQGVVVDHSCSFIIRYWWRFLAAEAVAMATRERCW